MQARLKTILQSCRSGAFSSHVPVWSQINQGKAFRIDHCFIFSEFGIKSEHIALLVTGFDMVYVSLLPETHANEPSKSQKR